MNSTSFSELSLTHWAYKAKIAAINLISLPLKLTSFVLLANPTSSYHGLSCPVGNLPHNVPGKFPSQRYITFVTSHLLRNLFFFSRQDVLLELTMQTATAQSPNRSNNINSNDADSLVQWPMECPRSAINILWKWRPQEALATTSTDMTINNAHICPTEQQHGGVWLADRNGRGEKKEQHKRSLRKRYGSIFAPVFEGKLVPTRNSASLLCIGR